MQSDILPWQTYSDQSTGFWFVLQDAHGYEVGSCDGGYEEKDARRIIVCVNACAGISDAKLNELGFLNAIQDIKQQRDELLAALKEIANLPRARLLPHHRIADKAIVKADLTQQ